jgi:hypothetical protein
MPTASAPWHTTSSAALHPLPAPADDFGHALGALEAGHWHDAFAELAALADGGHVTAARIVLTMAGRGGRLFGGHFHASAEALARWRQLAG